MTREIEQPVPPKPLPENPRPADQSDPVAGLWLRSDNGGAGLPRKVRVAAAATACLACFGLLLGLLSWVGHPQTPVLFTLMVTDQEDEGIFPVPFGLEDKKLLTAGGAFDRVNSTSLESVNLDQALGILRDVERVPASENLVLYVSARSAIDNDGKVVILAADSRLESRNEVAELGRTLGLERIFETMARSRAARKLLVLDIFHKTVSLPAGIINSDIAQRVELEFEDYLGRVGADHPASEKPFHVLMTCSPGQNSYASLPLGHGVFCHFLGLALAGKLPSEPRSGINRLGKIYLSDLEQILFPHIDRWVEQNDLDRQTPVLLPRQKKEPLTRTDAGPGVDGDILIAIPKVRFVPSQQIAAALASTWEQGWTKWPSLKEIWGGHAGAEDKADSGTPAGDPVEKAGNDKEKDQDKDKGKEKDKEKGPPTGGKESDGPKDKATGKDAEGKAVPADKNPEKGKGDKETASGDKTAAAKQSVTDGVPEEVIEAWTLFQKWTDENLYMDHPRILNKLSAIARSGLVSHSLGLDPKDYTPRVRLGVEQARDQMRVATNLKSNAPIFFTLGLLSDSGQVRENPEAIAGLTKVVKEQSAVPPGQADRDQLAKKILDEFNKAHPGLSSLEFEDTLVKGTLLLPDLSGNRLALIGSILRQGLGQQEPKVLESRLLARLAQSQSVSPVLARECLRANQVCNRAASRWRVYALSPREMEEMMEKCLAGTWIVENCPEIYGDRAMELFGASDRRASFLEAFNATLRDAHRMLWLSLQDIAAYQNFPAELPPGWQECAKGAALVLDRLEAIEHAAAGPSGGFLENLVRALRIEVDNLEEAYDEVHFLANPASIADFEKLTASQKNSPAILQELNTVIRLGGLRLEDRLRLIQTYRRISEITAHATLKTEINELVNQIPLPALPQPSPFRQHGLDEADVASLNKVFLGMVAIRILAPKVLGEWGKAAEDDLENVIRIARAGGSPAAQGPSRGESLPGADALPRGRAGMELPSLLAKKGGIWDVFGDRDRKLKFWGESSAFFRQAFMVLVPEAMQADRNLSYRVNLGYPGWLLNPVLDDPFRNPLDREQNEGRQKHLEWIVERLRHQSRLGLDKEFVNQVIEAMGAKFDFMKGTGLFTGPPIPVPPPKVGESVLVPLPWENDGLTGEELQNISVRALSGNTDPFSAKAAGLRISPDRSAGTVLVRIERMQDTSGGLTQKPVDVAVELRVPRPSGDRYWFSILRIGAEDDANKPKILVKSLPEGGEAIGSEIKLRGGGSRLTIYPAVRQDSGKNQSFLLSLHPQSGEAFSGPAAIATGSGLETVLPLGTGAKTASPGASPQDLPPQAVAVPAREDGYRMDLPARLVIDLLDPTNTRTPANTRTLEITRTDPADLVELVSVEVSPDGAKRFGPDQKCDLRVALRAKRSLAGAPPCKVAILLDQPTGTAGASSESGNIAGIVPPDPGSLLVLEARGIRSSGVGSGEGQFTLSVDGLPMTFRFRADFKPGSGLESAELVREPVLGLNVAVAPVTKPADPKFLAPEKDPPLLVEAWASQAPAGAHLRLTLLGGERFDNPEMVETLPKAMRSAVILKPGEKGGWEFSCDEGTWKRQWPTDGLKGRKKVRLELLDKEGKCLATREAAIILDPTPPVFGQFFGLPERALPGAAFRFTFLVTDPESGIASVVGNLGTPAGKVPGEPAPPPSLPEVQVFQSAKSREAAVLVPPDAKGTLTINLKAVNGAGLETTWSTTVPVSGKIPPPAPAVLGTVTEGGRPQKGLTVLLKDEKGKELAKAVTDEKGAYRLDDLKPGKVSVEVTKGASRRSAKKALTLQPGPPAVADLSLLE